MSLQTASIVYDNTTDAAFRQWASDFYTLLLNTGFTAHATTGDINFTTVTKPTVGNDIRGFRILKWNDGLTELYLKVFFGSGNDGATQCQFSVQVGWAVDAAGAFTGAQVSARFDLRFTAGTFATRACKSGAAWKVCVNDSVFACGDRSRNISTGATDTAGTTIVACNPGLSVNSSVSGFFNQGLWEYVASSGGTWGNVAYNNRRWGAQTPTFSGSFGRGGNIAFLPFSGWDAGWKPPIIAAVLVSAADSGVAGVNFTVPIYGTNHVYRRVSASGDSDSWTGFCLIDE